MRSRSPFAHIFVLIAFLINSFGFIPVAQAQDFKLPAPGVIVRLSPSFDPPMLKGIKIHPDNPFRLDFILDKGDSTLSDTQLKDESNMLVKYFLASLTIPEKDLWVNLSPYEKDRIIPNSFGLTEMGRDLLAEDYILKQVTASLIYPEDEIGKKFWKRIYKEAKQRFGTTDIAINTFNKVWIVPEKAVVYENVKEGTAYVVESKLKVMLEQDYLSQRKHVKLNAPTQTRNTNQLGSQMVREVVIPELTKEVNEGKNFAQLRQVFNSLILATWYKKKVKDRILDLVYTNKNKVAGVNINDAQEKERIYQRYLRAFKKGVYNYIKEEPDPLTQQMLPRKYFSGGVSAQELSSSAMIVTRSRKWLNYIKRTALVLLSSVLILSNREGLAQNSHLEGVDNIEIGVDAVHAMENKLNDFNEKRGKVSQTQAEIKRQRVWVLLQRVTHLSNSTIDKDLDKSIENSMGVSKYHELDRIPESRIEALELMAQKTPWLFDANDRHARDVFLKQFPNLGDSIRNNPQGFINHEAEEELVRCLLAIHQETHGLLKSEADPVSVVLNIFNAKIIWDSKNPGDLPSVVHEGYLSSMSPQELRTLLTASFNEHYVNVITDSSPKQKAGRTSPSYDLSAEKKETFVTQLVDILEGRKVTSSQERDASIAKNLKRFPDLFGNQDRFTDQQLAQIMDYFKGTDSDQIRGRLATIEQLFKVYGPDIS